MITECRNSNILSFMSEEEKNSLTAIGNIIKFDNESYLFMQGDSGDAFYIIKSGTVSISTTSGNGDEIILQTLCAGDVFGEVAMLDQSCRTANAFAGSGTELVSIDRAKFLSFLEKNPSMNKTIINILCARLRWISHLVESFAFSDSMDRLIFRLVYLAEYSNGDNNHALINISQDNLSKMLGLSRKIVNKNLNELQEKGLITIERKRILIHNIKKIISFSKNEEGE